MPIELRKVSKDVVAELQHQWLEPLSKLPDVFMIARRKRLLR